MNNGVSLCNECHLKAEQTEISVEEILDAIGFVRYLPPSLDPEMIYDTWGNILLEDGRIIYGSMRSDEGMLKATQAKRHLFIDRVKYPSTPYLLDSHSVDPNDSFVKGDLFKGQQVIVTEKVDGECTTLGYNYTHARSLDSRHHESRSHIKNMWSQKHYQLPEGWRVCGENMYAKHSISYFDLDSYFLGFSVWNEKNECLPWSETLEWFELLDLTPVPVLYEGEYDASLIHRIWRDYSLDVRRESEGYVIRLTDGFNHDTFSQSVAKWVRPNHVQTTDHWAHGIITPNHLKES